MSSFADSVQLVSTPRRRLLAAIGVTVVLSVGCGDGPTDPAPAVPASITAVSATALSGIVGQPVTPLPSVVVRNQHGDAMFGVRVNFTVTGGAGSITGATAFTDANGVATVGSWTLGPTAGDNTLAASVGSLPAVTFVATAQAGPPATLAKNAGDEQTGSVGAALPIAPAVIVQDALGNPVAGVTVTFEVASGGGSITGATAVTSSLGIAAVGSWTLGTSPGPNTLTATMGAHTVTFTATAVAGPPAAIAKVAGDNQTAVVAQAVPVPPSVRITDVHGNPVPGATVTFAAATGGGSVTGGSQVTDADGVATVGSWTLGTSTGTNTLTATVGSLTTTFTATATVGAPANLDKQAGDAQSATVGTAVATAPTVRLTDAHGNPIAGAAVVFAVASGGGSVTGASQTTDSDGVATVGSWTLGTSVGTNTLTASAGALDVTFTATAIAGAVASVEKLAGDGQTATVGTAVAVDPSVKVVDSFGNPVEGVTVTFAATSGGGSETGSSQTSDSDGIATVGSWILGTTPGENELTATAGSFSAIFTATAMVGPPANIVAQAGDDQSATVNTAVATDPTVLVTDTFGNPVPGISVTFTASGDGSVTGGIQVTDASGLATVGSWTLDSLAGVNTLTASVDAITAMFTATGVAGPPAEIIIVSDADQGARVDTDVPDPPSVKVVDEFGNPAAGVIVTFTVTGGGGLVNGESTVDITTGADGIATVDSWTVGPAEGPNELTAEVGTLSVVFTATGTP